MMMGAETEFGILDGWQLGKAEAILRSVSRSQPFLRAQKEGIFLANGGRAYVDHGKHNEYSTPETASPSELVLHELGGRQLMADCAAAVNCTLLCSNVDPRTGYSWGTHENYQCSTRFTPDRLALLYPHLVSRILYTGAGGICPDHPGVKTVLSARASMVRAPYAIQGHVCKTLVFAKPEPYCSGDRLHLFCGESLLSHRANYLKYATTALVTCCLDAGVAVGPGPLSESPVRVLRKINRDHTIVACFRTHERKWLTALEMQEAYLADVAAHLDILPPWAGEACVRWRDMLERLRNNDPSLCRQLDWMIFRTAFLELADEFGYDEEKLAWLNQSVLPNAPSTLKSAAKQRFQRFRAAANELYVRFHILGADSIFQRLDQGGLLDHHLPEITPATVGASSYQAPQGRAAIRSTLIHKYHGLEHFRASWDRLIDRTHDKELPLLADPEWQGDEPWQACSPGNSGDNALVEYQSLRNNALGHVTEGDFDSALQAYRALLAVGFDVAATHGHMARVFLLADRWDDARNELDSAWAARITAASYVVQRILFMKALWSLVSGNDATPYLSDIKKRLEDQNAHLDWTIAPVLDHLAARLEPTANVLMRTLAKTLCDRTALPELTAMPEWQAIPCKVETDQCPARREESAEPDADNFSFGKVVSVFETTIVVTEYDFSTDSDIQMTYTITPETEFANTNTLTGLTPGDDVVMDYALANGQRRLVTLVHEEKEPQLPLSYAEADVPF